MVELRHALSNLETARAARVAIGRSSTSHHRRVWFTLFDQGFAIGPKLAAFSETSDVIYTISRAQYAGHPLAGRVPVQVHRYLLAALYMLVKYSSRFVFYRVASWLTLRRMHRARHVYLHVDRSVHVSENVNGGSASSSTPTISCMCQMQLQMQNVNHTHVHGPSRAHSPVHVHVRCHLDRGWRCVREVRNPHSADKRQEIACRYGLDVNDFHRSCRSLLWFWPLLP